MKKIYLVALLVAGLSASLSNTAFAADGPGLPTRAHTLTQKMAEKIKMNDRQFIKIRSLNLRMLAEMEEAKKQRANAAAYDELVADVQMRYEWDLAAILWPRQLAAYNEAKISQTALNGR